jgi:hypothetical protein
MASLIHLCRKDYSFAKHVLLGSWVVFLVAALMPRFITGALADAALAILGPLWAVQYFQIFASVLKILRTDSFSGGNAFIGTRPVTMTMLWLSKLVAIAAFVLWPYLLAQVIGVWVLRVHLTPGDWMLFLIEKKLLFGMPAAIALIVGTHTRHFVWTTLLTIAFGALMLWLATSIEFHYGRPRAQGIAMAGRAGPDFHRGDPARMALDGPAEDVMEYRRRSNRAGGHCRGLHPMEGEFRGATCVFKSPHGEQPSHRMAWRAAHLRQLAQQRSNHERHPRGQGGGRSGWLDRQPLGYPVERAFPRWGHDRGPSRQLPYLWRLYKDAAAISGY